jgi:hypothetical protein
MWTSISNPALRSSTACWRRASGHRGQLSVHIVAFPQSGVIRRPGVLDPLDAAGQAEIFEPAGPTIVCSVCGSRSSSHRVIRDLSRRKLCAGVWAASSRPEANGLYPAQNLTS